MVSEPGLKTKFAGVFMGSYYTTHWRGVCDECETWCDVWAGSSDAENRLKNEWLLEHALCSGKVIDLVTGEPYASSD